MTDEQPQPYTTAAWATEGSDRWASVADRIEAQLQPVSDVLFAAAQLRAGERVLDVGCGRGSTTREAASLVGPGGTVWGLDVSETLLDVARALPEPSGAAPIEWVLGDGQTHPWPADRFDVVLSRFGALFFDDPVTAFAHLREATRPGGRLCITAWQHRDRSEIFRRPLACTLEAAAKEGHALELPAGDAGPFALGDEDEATRVLTAAGWAGVAFEPHEVRLYAGGAGTVEDAVALAFELGAVHNALEDAPDSVRRAVRDALTEDYTVLHDGTGVPMAGAIAILSATNPA
jgi:SAM-dependent methyltransferase